MMIGGVALIQLLVLFLLIYPELTGLRQIDRHDQIVILLAAVLFAGLYIAHRTGWFKDRFDKSLADLQSGLWIISQELHQATCREELEATVNWEFPSNLGLQSAELSFKDRASGPYALRLPLTVNKVSLGTLYLGPKIGGEKFTKPELALFSELQKRVSFTLWSLELDQTIQRTEELTRLKSKFLANVTHELRTPLNGIINYIGFVVDGVVGPLNDQQLNYLRQALQNSEKLLQIINNILDMNKIEAGQMTLQSQPVDLTEVVTEITPLVQEILHNKPVELVTKISSPLPVLDGDRLRLRQIMLNLLSNAAKFTETGTVWLNLYATQDYTVIQVADTGTGIEAAVLPTVFQQFTGTGLADRQQRSGSGLGLPITKALVTLHGGKIDISSQAGQGTTVTVTLPVERDDLPANEELGLLKQNSSEEIQEKSLSNGPKEL